MGYFDLKSNISLSKITVICGHDVRDVLESDPVSLQGLERRGPLLWFPEAEGYHPNDLYEYAKAAIYKASVMGGFLSIVTNSAIVMDALRYQVRKGQVNNADINISYVDANHRVRIVGIQDSGAYSRAPEDFFNLEVSLESQLK